MTENHLRGVVLDAAIEVHRTLGDPGLLESVYEEALCHELFSRDLKVRRQVEVPSLYKGRRLASDLKVDLLVEGLVVVERKATTNPHPVHVAQTLTYLRRLDLRLGSSLALIRYFDTALLLLASVV